MVWPFNVSVPLFRSEDMSYVSVTVTNDASYETLMEIGKFGRFHFVDVRHAAHRTAPHPAISAFSSTMDWIVPAD